MHANRRDLLLAGACAASTALFCGAAARLRAEEPDPPPEITTIRLGKSPSICIAPQYVVSDLLNAEGFTNVVYVETGTYVEPASGVVQNKALGKGDLDFYLNFSGPILLEIDRGLGSTVLAGIHVGCFELFAKDGIRSVADLKGRTVGILGLESPQHVFLSAMASLVGLDPAKDIEWVSSPFATAKELFLQRKIDAFLALPPDPQDLRARKIGHVIVDSARDRPWSQHFCCVLVAGKEFVRKHPVATKRALRAILKATDFCASNPAAVARRLVDGGFTGNYDYALQTLNEVWYNKWREYDAEDSVRFYSLRLREAGMIKSTPAKIIADGTNWRFLNELKRELKG